MALVAKSSLRVWAMVLPALVMLGFVGVIPVAINTWHSFFDIFSLDAKYWVGLEWYGTILGDRDFYAAMVRSFGFSVAIILAQFPLGIFIALMIPKQGVMRAVCLVLVAIPLMVPWLMIPSIWLSLINPTGYVGQVFHLIGFEFDWKFNAIHTWGLLIAMDTWHWVGLVTILTCSGLASIPDSYYQAAAIDQANRLQIFTKIEFPKLINVLMVALLLRFMDSFMIYTEAFGINAGGPDGKTTFLSLALGEEIKAFNYGPAAARSVIYFAITLMITFGFWRMFAPGDADENRMAQ